MAITPLIVVFDLDVSSSVTDATALAVWKATLTYAHVYGWAVTPLGNSRFRYTIVYD